MKRLQGAFGVVVFSSYAQEDGTLKKGLEAQSTRDVQGRNIAAQKTPCG
jgi:hypothetical protein